MIQKWKKITGFYCSIVDWGEILNGFLLLLLGMTFNRYYGYRFEWENYINLCLWYFFLESSVYCLKAVLSGDVFSKLGIAGNARMNTVDFRLLMVRIFWVLAILFAAMGFIPLIQNHMQNRINGLSLLLISLVYVNSYTFFFEGLRKYLAGMLEFIYAFSCAFLLPALCFSLSQDYLKSTLILITFPLFILLIAWKVGANLEKSLKSKRIPAFSLVERLGPSNSLYVISSLLVLGTITLFLETNITGIWTKLILLPLGLAAAWFGFRSVRVQTPNWDKAYLLVRLLPAVVVISIIVSLWMY